MKYLYLVILTFFIGGVIGFVIGILTKSWKNVENNCKGTIFIDRIEKEPYVTGCWLGIKDEKDLTGLRDGENVIFTVRINHIKNEDPDTFGYSYSYYRNHCFKD